MFKNPKNSDIFGYKAKILTNCGHNWIITPYWIAPVSNRAVSCLTRRFDFFLSVLFFWTPCKIKKIVDLITNLINIVQVLILNISKTCFKSRRYCAICNGLINQDRLYNLIQYSSTKYICTFLCRIFYSKLIFSMQLSQIALWTVLLSDLKYPVIYWSLQIQSINIGKNLVPGI